MQQSRFLIIKLGILKKIDFTIVQSYFVYVRNNAENISLIKQTWDNVILEVNLK